MEQFCNKKFKNEGRLLAENLPRKRLIFVKFKFAIKF